MTNQPDHDFVEYVSGRLARLHRAAYLMCGDEHRADDLVQTTLVSLYASWAKARRADNLDGYVHRILVRRFIDEKRSAWSRVLLRDRLPDVAESPDETHMERAAIVSALHKLPARQRATVVLRYYSDFSVEQTAAALGCSVGTVKSQCARGLSALRTHLVAEAETAAGAGFRPARRSAPLQPAITGHGR